MTDPYPVFHEGELASQDRMGVRERVGTLGQRLMRDHMIDQHRKFYAELPFLVLGSVDAEGHPWASIVTGRPGFLSTPDERVLDVAARPVAGDPLAQNLKAGGDIGIVGMQLETRRRNRMNGRVTAVREDGFGIGVVQSYGNCPKFIQTRTMTLEEAKPTLVTSSDALDGQARALIERADTLFIASAYGASTNAPGQGADVSHRGGKPGFVRVEDDNSFVFPDFSGNNLFNTVGNLTMNPHAGFLFPDFENGGLLTMTGETEIIWDGPEVDAFTGAQRLIRFRAKRVHHIENGLPLRASFEDYSPYLAKTGDWEHGGATGRHSAGACLP